MTMMMMMIILIVIREGTCPYNIHNYITTKYSLQNTQPSPPLPPAPNGLFYLLKYILCVCMVQRSRRPALQTKIYLTDNEKRLSYIGTHVPWKLSLPWKLPVKRTRNPNEMCNRLSIVNKHCLGNLNYLVIPKVS